MSYVISGLENAKQYYLRATGKTLHGITLDTGFILITISYTIAQVFNTLELNNKAEYGAIEIKSNIVSAIGVSEKDVIYIGDEYADLHDNSVTFDEGLEVRGDFTKIFVFYEPERNKSIISFGDGDRLKVDIYYRKGKYADSNGEKAYFELVANSCGTNYVRNSGYVNIPNSNYQQFALLINRIGSYYDLKVVLISAVIRYSASADGSYMTESRQPNSRYVGVGYMPKEIYENPNLLENSDFRNGVTNWNGDFASSDKTLVSSPVEAKNIEFLTVRYAIFGEIYVSNDLIDIIDFNGSVPQDWDFNTRLHALFKNNLNGGNVNFSTDIVESIRIKRRVKGELIFKTIYEKPIVVNDDFKINLLDYMEPVGNIEYAYVPIISDTKFTKHLNHLVGVVELPNRLKPVVIKGGITNYISGDIECTFIENQDCKWLIGSSWELLHKSTLSSGYGM